MGEQNVGYTFPPSVCFCVYVDTGTGGEMEKKETAPAEEGGGAGTSLYRYNAHSICIFLGFFL